MSITIYELFIICINIKLLFYIIWKFDGIDSIKFDGINSISQDRINSIKFDRIDSIKRDGINSIIFDDKLASATGKFFYHKNYLFYFKNFGHIYINILIIN